MTSISERIYTNQLKLNPDKTELILTGGAANPWDSNFWPPLLGSSPRPVDTVKSLGVIICNDLSPKPQINAVGGLPVKYNVDVNKQHSHRCLDNNHSHFILVDDGTRGDYWARIPLRTKLERFISKQRMKEDVDMTIPIVCVVLAGGLTTLDIIHSSMTNGTPCVIVEGSGRVADVIAQVADMDPSKTTIALTGNLSSLSETSLSAEEINACTKKIQDIVGKSHLLTIFREDKDNARYLDVTMALLKGQ
ncbi:transient receptor potential cation channel subfamily M member 2-like [Lissotriton helveticus]